MVREYAGTHKGRASWLCQCDCGKQVTCFTVNLTRNHSTSCGCYSREKAKQRATKHGESHSAPEYVAWYEMQKRCLDEKNHKYSIYGARGITICDRWLNSYENFLADMGRRPSPKHSLDRIDVNGNYEPSNCRWASVKEQANNRRDNIHITWNGVTKTLSQWAESTGIKYATIRWRFHAGWSPLSIFEEARSCGRS